MLPTRTPQYFLCVAAFLKTIAVVALPQDIPPHLGALQGKWAPQVPIVHPLYSTCAEPSIRKEWRSMPHAEKDAWIRAIKCLGSLPSPGNLVATGGPPDDPVYVKPPINKSASAYDDFAYAHMDVNERVHQTGLFFPFHRYFVWSFEQTLKQMCNYTGSSPYWDWTKDANDFPHATIFDPDPQIGLGGFGDAVENYVVPDGAFAGFSLAYPTPHVLRRQYLPYPYLNLSLPLYTKPNVDAASMFAPGEVQKIVSGYRGDFEGFQTYTERSEGMHMSVHFIMGGDLLGMCPYIHWSKCMHDATPNDPLFWLHHSMMDKLWFDWQYAHPDNFFALAGGTVRDLPSWPKYPVGLPPAVTPETSLPSEGILFGNYTIGDMFNTTSNGPLCYTYQ